MTEPVVHSTFVIDKSYPVAPATLFAAFADPEQKRRWYAQGESHTIREYRMDFRVGGSELWDAVFDSDSPFPGQTLASRGVILDIVPDARIVLAADMMLGEHRFSASLITVEIEPTAKGAALRFTHQGAFFEHADGPEMREEGWRKLLAGLEAQLEPAAAAAG